MELGLRGKVAVITGGSVGIGLAAENVDLMLAARDGARAMVAAEELVPKHGVRAIGLSTDIATAAGREAVVTTRHSFGNACGTECVDVALGERQVPPGIDPPLQA